MEDRSSPLVGRTPPRRRRTRTVHDVTLKRGGPLAGAVASVVLLRGVNVGGARRVSTAAVAKAIGATNVGAAGTFVVKRADAATKLEKDVRAALGFDTQIIVRPARMIEALVAREAERVVPAGARRYLTVLSCAPEKQPRLPIVKPDEGAWTIRVVERERSLVVSLRKPGGSKWYPNVVVEKAYGVPATTRDWATVEKVAALLA